MTSTLHTGEDRETKRSHGTPWLIVGVITVALFVYYWLLKPVFWWVFRSVYLSNASDEMLEQDGIFDPGRERWHVVAGAALFGVAAISALLSYQHWNLGFLIAAFIASTLFAGVTAAYYKNEEENAQYPRAGYLE